MNNMLKNKQEKFKNYFRIIWNFLYFDVFLYNNNNNNNKKYEIKFKKKSINLL